MMTLLASFKGRLAVAAPQHAFSGHYLDASAATPTTTYVALFKLIHPPPSALCMTLSCLQGVAGNAYYGYSDNTYDAAKL